MKLTEYEKPVWDISFSCIVSMAHCHPGTGRSNGYVQQHTEEFR